MVEIPRSSFIPKETTGMTPGRVRRKRTFHVFGFIATVLLVGSLITAALVFFLKSTAESGLQDAKTALSEQKNLFNPEHINEVREFDRRLRAAEQLIKNHISPLKVFSALEEQAKQKIQFTSFLLEHTPSFETLVTLRGTTREFKTLALQESGFAGDSLLKDVMFNEVSTQDQPQEDGQGGVTSMITFTLSGIVDTSRILYDGQTVRSRVEPQPFTPQPPVEAATIEVDEDAAPLNTEPL
jgi:hypothetical protein